MKHLFQCACGAALGILFAASFASTAWCQETITLSIELRNECLKVLREGLASAEFWPAMHAAEALTVAGHGAEVRAFLTPKLPAEKDDQRRCGLARELVRAGDRSHVRLMLDILAGSDTHGHVHAAESLYKVNELGDGLALRRAYSQNENPKLRLMAAGALGRWGSPAAMQYLREQLPHADPEISKIAAWILGVIGTASDIPPLRNHLAHAPDAITRAYHEHALALLGDDEGKRCLRSNLSDADPMIRTYAANFAGDARVIDAREDLRHLLADDNVDVRVRAAQALLTLAQPAPLSPRASISSLLFPATAEHPRYTEGSAIELQDGALLLAATEFSGSSSDFARARIVARTSHDGGRTWDPARVLQESTGQMNVMSVTLRRLSAPAPPGTIALFYLEKNDFNNLHVLVRLSHDEGRSFGEPIRVTTEPGYHVLNNDRVTQLSSGRLLVPVATTADVQKVNHFVSLCWISDDGGQTWRKGTGQVDLPQRGAMEPEVIELADGRVLMIIRTQLGHIATAYSADGGDHWSEPSRLEVRAPEAPATLRRIPSTGDLLLIWNNTFEPGAGHGGRRTPLTAAVSSDEGKTWRHVQDLEADPQRTYAYTSVLFTQGRAVLSYWESEPGTDRLSTRFRSLPLSWFYEAP